MVDLLMLPFLCLLEGICKCVIYIRLVIELLVKFVFWLIVVSIWDAFALGFHIVAWITCAIFHWRTPHLKLGKYLVLYSKW